MSTADSNENSVILALIEQNSALQKSLVEIIRARDANEAERRANDQVLAQQEAQRLADEAKAQEDYYKSSLMPVVVSLIAPLIQSVIGTGPQVEDLADFSGIDPNSEQH